MSSDDHTQNPRGPAPPIYDSNLSERPPSGCSLVGGLEGIVDGIRQIATDLGARPYTYHSVTVRWSGGEIGRGAAETVRDVAIVPTPRTEPLGYMDRELASGGTAERGDVVLTGLSPRLTEDEIDVLFGVAVDDADEVFIEQRIDQRDGTTRRKRFMLAKAPERRPTKVDWRVVLRRADGDRQRDGTPRKTRDRVWR